MTHIVLDNCVSVDTQNKIHEYLMAEETDWKFARYFSYKDNPEIDDEKRKNMFNFSCIIYDMESRSKRIDIFLDLVNEAAPYLPWNLEYVFKIRSELQLPIITDRTHGNIHVDCHPQNPFIVLLYYVNDSDGETILFNETTKTISTEEVMNGKVTELIRVAPKKGRILAFDGNMYHASGRPKKEYRCVLNYNISIV